MDKIESELASKGWALFNDRDIIDSGVTAMVDFSARFGTLSMRDGGKALWPIVPISLIGTFSQTNSEAALHTDAQYHAAPEDLIILFCERPASSGGESFILEAYHIVDALKNNSSLDKILRQPIWQWKVPSVFCINQASSVSKPKAVITDNDEICWRYDNLIANSPDKRFYADQFQALLRTLPAHEIFLKYGDILICRNKHVLHGRASFDDVNRKFYRTRLWK